MPIWAAVILAATIVAGGQYALKELGTRHIREYEKHLADRLAAGEDRYFEELRALQAYDPRRRSRRFHAVLEAIQIIGTFVVLVWLFSRMDL